MADICSMLHPCPKALNFPELKSSNNFNNTVSICWTSAASVWKECVWHGLCTEELGLVTGLFLFIAGVSELGGCGARLIFRLRTARPDLEAAAAEATCLLFLVTVAAGIGFGTSLGEASFVESAFSVSLGWKKIGLIFLHFHDLLNFDIKSMIRNVISDATMSHKF